MNSIVKILKEDVAAVIHHLYGVEITEKDVQINETKPGFRGDYTLVTFGLSKVLKLKPADIADQIGQQLLLKTGKYNFVEVVQGFLNIEFNDQVWLNCLAQQYQRYAHDNSSILVEYSSPNTNKPLHFGHMRNIFLGDAVCRLLHKNGTNVIKANLINDRGIHICKSMVAWKNYANGANPDSMGVKGDHFVGDYYVKYNTIQNEQVEPILLDIYNTKKAPSYFSDAHQQKINTFLQKLEEDLDEQKSRELKSEIKEIANNYTAILKEAKQMLLQWEQGDEEVLLLWKTMNNWVYEGFNETYQKMGIHFDKYYYESNTYLLGKQLVLQALEKGLVYQKEDKSVWVDLSDKGLDQKLLLRGDGTSVYMTQDIGTAKLKYDDFGMNRSVYVIGDEQNYHMQVLKLIMEKFEEPCADGIYHLSYGMVELPSGRMKSREGTVVDADDMIEEMRSVARQKTIENGKTEGFTEAELEDLYTTLGLGALKFFLLRVDPKRKMIFNPEESIDFHGFTGPFVQYTHARTSSILRKEPIKHDTNYSLPLLKAEKDVLYMIEQYSGVVNEAAQDFNPSILCNYLHDLARCYNSMYDELSILKAENEEKKQLRLNICFHINQILKDGLGLLGITAPERM